MANLGLIAILIPMSLIAADLRIDHVTVGGRSLRGLQEGLSRAGIRTEYGGKHTNRATEMAIASFPDGSYLELIALQPEPDKAMLALHPWARWIESDGGPCGWAVRPADLAAEAARLRAAGIPVNNPQRGGRERPDGIRLDWENATVGEEGTGVFFPFLIHDLTPRGNRAYPGGKPSASEFVGVSKVTIAVKDLNIAIRRYRQAYGLAAPETQFDSGFGAQLAWFRGTPVVLASPLSPQSWIADRLVKLGEGPCAFVLKATEPTHLPSFSKSTWFKSEVGWFDPARIGWRLGVE